MSAAFTLTPAALEEAPILANLMELYLYESTGYDPVDISPDGRYGYHWLPFYWQEAGRYPFLARLDDRLAGFVLVNRHSLLPPVDGSPPGHAVAEFFILSKYRRQGLGRRAAARAFELFPGRWEAAVLAANLPAQDFWRAVIAGYTGGRYTETWLSGPAWKGPVFTFDSAPPGAISAQIQEPAA
jgi:predicted acetyltransferase